MRKTGNETIHEDGQCLGTSILSFWQWSSSDIVSNATRGVLAEFLVATALEGAPNGVRREWDAYDLRLRDGTKIEVKSSAFLQAWKQKKPSRITFSVARRRAWDAETGITSKDQCRHADVYVFALLKHMDLATLDPLDLAQWDFFVLPTHVLDARNQHSISLASLHQLEAGPVPFRALSEAVRKARTSGSALIRANTLE